MPKGRKIAANLAQDYPDQVVIAGRNVEKASRAASGLGHGVRARHIDVTDRHAVDKAMDGVGVVMSCVAQPATPHLLLASISHGCGYTATGEVLCWGGLPLQFKPVSAPCTRESLPAPGVDFGWAGRAICLIEQPVLLAEPGACTTVSAAVAGSFR